MIEIIPNWHPVFVHFTVALLLVAAGFYVLAFPAGERWGSLSLQAARINLFTGVVLTVATVVAGFYAYNSVQHDGPSHAAMTIHRNWALTTAALWALTGIWEGWRSWRRQGRSLAVATAVVIAAGLLGVTGYKGGELVFGYGLGVQSLPNMDAHQHPGGASSSHPHEESSDGHSHDGGPDSGHAHASGQKEHAAQGADAAADEATEQRMNAPAEEGATDAHHDDSPHSH